MNRTTLSERAVVLAPRGRDAALGVAMLGDAGIAAEATPTLPALLQMLGEGAGVAVVTEEALATADLAPLAAWIAAQQEWSDLPFVLLTSQGGGLERNPAARRYLDVLGNATFVERPFHPTTLISLVRAALRGRRRQYEARSLNETLESRVADALAGRKVFADVVEGTDALVQVAGLDYRWLAINEAAATDFERVHGVRPRVGDNMLELLSDHPDRLAAVRSVWSRALAGHEFTETTELGDGSPDRRVHEMKFNALRDAEGRLIGAYQFAYDVTDRVRDQSRLVEAQEQLRQAQKMEALGQLTGGVAHDFNNLLTIIKSSAYLLNRPGLQDDRRQRYLQTISGTVDRAAKLTGQLLAFARRQALKPKVFDIGGRIRAIGDMLQTVVGSRVDLRIALAAEACFVEADANQFETALVNMVVNGRDAMDEQGRLDLAVFEASQPAGDFVAVTIRDTGSGIAPDRVAHIFEPFFTTKEVGKGTGLGLSQAYGFAKQSGGELTVESEVGRGSTFTLLLPRAERPALPAVAPSEAEPAESALGDGRRVLVVEDNADVGMFSSRLLRDLGYETVWAPDALEALRLLDESQGYHAVFSDVVMPGMSGIELGHEIQRRHPQVPVILTSGYSHVLAQEGRHGFELLQKPYAVEELSRVLRRLPTR